MEQLAPAEKLQTRDLAATKPQVWTGEGTLVGIQVCNNQAAVVFIQLFDALAANVSWMRSRQAPSGWPFTVAGSAMSCRPTIRISVWTSAGPPVRCQTSATRRSVLTSDTSSAWCRGHSARMSRPAADTANRTLSLLIPGSLPAAVGTGTGR